MLLNIYAYIFYTAAVNSVLQYGCVVITAAYSLNKK